MFNFFKKKFEPTHVLHGYCGVVLTGRFIMGDHPLVTGEKKKLIEVMDRQGSCSFVDESAPKVIQYEDHYS